MTFTLFRNSYFSMQENKFRIEENNENLKLQLFNIFLFYANCIAIFGILKFSLKSTVYKNFGKNPGKMAFLDLFRPIDL